MYSANDIARIIPLAAMIRDYSRPPSLQHLKDHGLNAINRNIVIIEQLDLYLGSLSHRTNALQINLILEPRLPDYKLLVVGAEIHAHYIYGSAVSMAEELSVSTETTFKLIESEQCRACYQFKPVGTLMRYAYQQGPVCAVACTAVASQARTASSSPSPSSHSQAPLIGKRVTDL